MTFFSFDVDTAMLQTAFWQKLFLDVVKKELLGNILLTVDCSLGRYSPDEPKQITIKADTINLRGETFSLCPGDSSGLSLAVCVYNREGTLVWEHTGYLSLPCEVAFPLELSASSLYRVTVTVKHGDITLTRKETGFLVLSESELQDRLRLFHPMYIDENISTDYCLVDGKIAPVLDTTYFVTDAKIALLDRHCLAQCGLYGCVLSGLYGLHAAQRRLCRFRLLDRLKKSKNADRKTGCGQRL